MSNQDDDSVIKQIKQKRKEFARKKAKELIGKLDWVLFLSLVALLGILIGVPFLLQDQETYTCSRSQPGDRRTSLFIFQRDFFSFEGSCLMKIKVNGKFGKTKKFKASTCLTMMNDYNNQKGCIKHLEPEN